MPWLIKQGLAPLTWHTWRTLPAQCVPTGLASELRAALAYTVYLDPACRPMGDLDVWVAADEMPRAQAALEQLGYMQRIKSTRPLAFQMRNSGEVQMVGTWPGSGLVELHWGAFPGEWLRQTACVDELAIRARAARVTLADWPAMVLSPEDGIIQLAIHLAVNHQMAYPWFRGLVDITLLARAHPIRWDVIVARARAWRVRVATWQVLKLAMDLAGLNEAATAVTQLAPSALRRRLLGRLVSAGSLVEMRDLRLGLLRFVYLLLVVDRIRDAARLVWRALWPEREWLEARFGHSGPSAQLHHLAGAVRGEL